MHLPIADVYMNPTLLLATGLSIGVLSGFFGMGGAFIVTRALNVLGLPMEFAIGTGLAQALGKSVVGVYKHAMLRHIDWVLGLSIGLSAMLGVDWGRSVIGALGRMGAADTAVSVAYVVFVLSLGTAICLETTRSLQNVGDSSEMSCGKVRTTKVSSWLKTVRLGPRVNLVKSGTGSTLLPVLVFLGVVSGFLSGVLGIGGAFIRVPMYIYILGVSTKLAVGTDLVAVLISCFWDTGIYGAAGKVELGATLVMLAGTGLRALAWVPSLVRSRLSIYPKSRSACTLRLQSSWSVLHSC
ncbi:MAG: sulfite exporter TauE/SafE family protein [Clostridia bacterium]